MPRHGDRTRQALFVQDNVSARLPNGLEARALQGSNKLVGPEGVAGLSETHSLRFGPLHQFVGNRQEALGS